jgi:hypothetical protein
MGAEGAELETAEEHDHHGPVGLEDQDALKDGKDVGKQVFGEGVVC